MPFFGGEAVGETASTKMVKSDNKWQTWTYSGKTFWKGAKHGWTQRKWRKVLNRRDKRGVNVPLNIKTAKVMESGSEILLFSNSLFEILSFKGLAPLNIHFHNKKLKPWHPELSTTFYFWFVILQIVTSSWRAFPSCPKIVNVGEDVVIREQLLT